MNREMISEAVGTSLLLYVIAGSGIAAETLTADPGIQLFAHAVAVGAGLGALIAMLQTVSGAHLNPAVTLAFWRTGTIGATASVRYVVAQILGAIVGVIAANVSFDLEIVSVATTVRSGSGLMVAEAIGTFVLVLVILGLVRTGRPGAVPAAVGAWVVSIVFATASTGFANPAVTLARVFTDSFTGIALASIPAFLVAQVVASLAAAGVAIVFYPDPVPERSHS